VGMAVVTPVAVVWAALAGVETRDGALMVTPRHGVLTQADAGRSPDASPHTNAGIGVG
jgi:hypothetical protein